MMKTKPKLDYIRKQVSINEMLLPKHDIQANAVNVYSIGVRGYRYLLRRKQRQFSNSVDHTAANVTISNQEMISKSESKAAFDP